MASRSPKRRRRSHPQSGRCAKKKHLYLALDDWRGGYSVHKLDPDDMPDTLSEPPAVRVTGADWGEMSFAAFGANILIAVNQHVSGAFHTSPPSLIYSTDTAALTVGPNLPHDHVCNLDHAMTAGGKLYARSWVFDKNSESFNDHLHVLQPTGLEDLWDPSLRFRWSSRSTPPLIPGREKITCHALHPDGCTIFMSTDSKCTYSFDTSNDEWKELGDWVLPFQGQAYYDRDLDAWVGLHAKEDRCVCLCPVASRSAATQPPECTMLREKLCRYKEEEDPKERCSTWSRVKATTLTYMGDGRFCLVDNIPRSEFVCDGSVVHVTLFGLKYDSRGELRTKAQRTTKSYAVSKNGTFFSHATFWM